MRSRLIPSWEIGDNLGGFFELNGRFSKGRIWCKSGCTVMILQEERRRDGRWWLNRNCNRFGGLRRLLTHRGNSQTIHIFSSLRMLTIRITLSPQNIEKSLHGFRELF